MYTIKDFLERKIYIVINNETQYNKTMKWLEKYNLQYYEAYLRIHNYYTLKDYKIYCGKNQPCINMRGNNSMLDVERRGYMGDTSNMIGVTIDDIDFDCNKVSDSEITTLSVAKFDFNWLDEYVPTYATTMDGSMVVVRSDDVLFF